MSEELSEALARSFNVVSAILEYRFKLR